MGVCVCMCDARCISHVLCSHYEWAIDYEAIFVLNMAIPWIVFIAFEKIFDDDKAQKKSNKIFQTI